MATTHRRTGDPQPADVLVIFGISGDLAKKMTFRALYRLEEKGWIAAEWGVSPEGRRAKLYRLTPKGRRRFAEARDGWRLFSGAVERVLAAT